MPNESLRIGVDFDNTLVCYDDAFVITGKEEKLLPQDFRGHSKTEVREVVRAREEGEYHWQRLQGLVYGRLISRAKLFGGAAAFLARATKAFGTEIFIVSHKTELAHHDPQRTNLHQAALGFMQEKGLFSGPHLTPAHVFFEPTCEKKLACVKALGCDAFIDDLPEVLLDAAFPEKCRKILFSSTPHADLTSFSSWQKIHDYLFPAKN